MQFWEISYLLNQLTDDSAHCTMRYYFLSVKIPIGNRKKSKYVLIITLFFPFLECTVPHLWVGNYHWMQCMHFFGNFLIYWGECYVSFGLGFYSYVYFSQVFGPKNFQKHQYHVECFFIEGIILSFCFEMELSKS